MEMMRGIPRRVHLWLAAKWLAFASTVAGFLEESFSRLSLALEILRGRVPLERERRFFNRNRETPLLIDAFDWTDDRLIFSVLVWPPLEADASEADAAFEERVQQVKRMLHKGTQELHLETMFVTHELWWNHEGEVWVDESGDAYDGSRFRDGGRPATPIGRGEA